MRFLRRCVECLLMTHFSLALPQCVYAPLPGKGESLKKELPVAFLGAEGFGALATGGRGGTTCHVVNLNDHGHGSFREAVSAGPRIVVFDVGGSIELAAAVKVASDITIEGQTAPGAGVCIRNYEVSFSQSHNVIARHLRIRQGLTPKTERKCAVNLHESRNIILDHLSIEWGRWDCIGLTNAKDITLQYCLIGEGIDPQRFGCLCQSDNVTFSHNLWIDNQSRNPKAKGTVQYVNNVVYNWGVTGYVGGHSQAAHSADLVGNYFIKGPSSSNRFAGEFTATDHIYQSGNFVDLDRNGQLNGHLASPAEFPGATIVGAAAMHPAVPVTVDTAEVAFQKVIAGAGASLHRDRIDARLIEQAKSLGKAGEIIHRPAEAGD
jgi:pectate lyase